MVIVYCHGWLSSPAKKAKADVVHRALQEKYPDSEISVLSLEMRYDLMTHNLPAWRRFIEKQLEGYDDIYFVGTSLGCFALQYMVCQPNIRSRVRGTVMYNPAYNFSETFLRIVHENKDQNSPVELTHFDGTKASYCLNYEAYGNFKEMEANFLYFNMEDDLSAPFKTITFIAKDDELLDAQGMADWAEVFDSEICFFDRGGHRFDHPERCLDLLRNWIC